MVWDTKTNLKKRAEAECGACEGKLAIAKGRDVDQPRNLAKSVTVE